MKNHKRNKYKGVHIKNVDKNSPAYSAGFRKGDLIIAVNDEPVEDELDFNFYSACTKLTIQTGRKGVRRFVSVSRKPGQLLGIEFAGISIKQCRNKCIFCFIDQLPKGLRKSLYIKDEDYRYSFMDGNYLTLSGMTQREINKILKISLSPLYISVHSTDPAVRKRMLNNRNAGEIISQLHTFEDNGIKFHTQIVVCPGINDGATLKKTIDELLAFKKGLLSIAVVPVGLTKHRKRYLKPISANNALTICNMVEKVSEWDRKKRGIRRLFIADEFLLKAGLDIPEHTYYEGYPQIENGVGLVSILLNEWKSIRRNIKNKGNKRKSPSKPSSQQRKKSYLTITSISAKPYIEIILSELNQCMESVEFVILPVRNSFFGESVTVAGLLTAHDIIKAVNGLKEHWDAVIIPGVIFNYNGYTLDGFSSTRIARKIDNKIEIVKTISELIDFILEVNDEPKRS